MADANETERLRAYLQQYGQRYTREALRAKLLASGADPAAVEEALAELYQPRSRRLTFPARISTAGCDMGMRVVCVCALLWCGVWALAVQLTQSQRDDSPVNIMASFLICGFPVMEVVIVFLLWRREVAAARYVTI